jgi:ADP-ribose pyrophosphatase
VKEETGLDAEIIGLLDTIEYFFRAGDTLIRKSVDFYLMHYTGGTMTPQLSEVDDAEWVALAEAIQRASFESERKLLSLASDQIDSVAKRMHASS